AVACNGWTVDNRGTVTVGDHASLSFSGGGWYNEGSLALGGNVSWSGMGAYLDNTHTVWYRPPSPSDVSRIDVPVTNEGELDLQGAGTLALRSYVQMRGLTQLTGGTLASASGLDIEGGALQGWGTVSGNVRDAGQLVLDAAAAGVLQVAGDL